MGRERFGVTIILNDAHASRHASRQAGGDGVADLIIIMTNLVVVTEFRDFDVSRGMVDRLLDYQS